VTKDALQQQAIRLYNDLVRIRKESRRAAMCDRAPLEARALEIAEELRVIVDKHERTTA
jgi:hypothetical protein